MSEPAPFTPEEVRRGISATTTQTPRWLVCPVCASGSVRYLFGENVVCGSGHEYEAPKGPIAFYMAARWATDTHEGEEG